MPGSPLEEETQFQVLPMGKDWFLCYPRGGDWIPYSPPWETGESISLINLPQGIRLDSRFSVRRGDWISGSPQWRRLLDSMFSSGDETGFRVLNWGDWITSSPTGYEIGYPVHRHDRR